MIISTEVEMILTTKITEIDEGKRVVDARGQIVGNIAKVRDGVAYLDPEPNMFGTIENRLGRDEIDEDTYPLRETDIAQITTKEIQLENFQETD